MATGHIYLAGHGKWHPSNHFFRVPTDYTINFYTHFAKKLTIERAKLALRGVLETTTTTEAGLMCPNLQILNLDEAYQEDLQGAFEANRSSTFLPWTYGTSSLSKVLSQDGMVVKAIQRQRNKGKFEGVDKFEVHWIACTSVKFKHDKDCIPMPGFNAADLSHRL